MPPLGLFRVFPDVNIFNLFTHFLNTFLVINIIFWKVNFNFVQKINEIVWYAIGQIKVTVVIVLIVLAIEEEGEQVNKLEALNALLRNKEFGQISNTDDDPDFETYLSKLKEKREA